MSDHDQSTIFYTRLVGEVYYTSVKEVMKDIDVANTQEHIKEIVLTMTSHGGDLPAAFALYDHIRASSKPIDIVVEGLCMSSAVMVLQAGRKRISRPHTVFMVHPSQIFLQEHDRPYMEFLSIVEQYRKNQQLFVELTISRSGIEKDKFEKLYSPRKYLTPIQAKKFGKNGLIDIISDQEV